MFRGYVPGKAGTAESVAHSKDSTANLMQPYFFFFATFFFAAFLVFLAAFFAFFAIRFSPPFGTLKKQKYQSKLIIAVVYIDLSKETTNQVLNNCIVSFI